MTSPRGEFGPDGPTTIEVDTGLVERAKTVLGVRTARRAVELALREVISRGTRATAGEVGDTGVAGAGDG